MTTDIFSAPNPHFKKPRYQVVCPYCGKLEVVKTWKTRNIHKKKCRGCGKVYQVDMSKTKIKAELIK